MRAISFVDAPGHEALMATMLSGAAIMDGVILVIAADEKCPQPQTREHLAAIEIVGVDKVIIAQNKVDLVDEKRALENYREIKKFLDGTIAAEAPIIPISAQHSINIDLLLYAIQEYIPTPLSNESKPARMHVVRSFDVNKPGTIIDEIKGGVIGGSIFQGILKVGDELEIKPGIRNQGKTTAYSPLYTKIVTLHTGDKNVQVARCGGLVGIGTLLDPSLTKADGLIGNLVGRSNTLPETKYAIKIETHLLKRVVGTKEPTKVKQIESGEILLVDLGTAPTVGKVLSVKGKMVDLNLTRPVCPEKGNRVALSRRIHGSTGYRLIGFGIVQ